jgi:hypothetical protein
VLNEMLLDALEDTHSRIRIVYSDDHTDRSIGSFRRGRRPPKGHPLGLHLDDLVTEQLCSWTISQCTLTIRHWEGWPWPDLPGDAADSSGRASTYARTPPALPLLKPSHRLILTFDRLISLLTNLRRELQLNDPQRDDPNGYF